MTETHVSVDYGDVAGLIAATQRPRLDHSSDGYGAVAFDNLEAGWTGCKTMDKARDLAANGWPEGLENWSEAQTSDFSQFSTPAPAATYDVGGERPDVPRFLAGAPDYMVTMGEDTGAKPIISIWISAFLSSLVKAQARRNQGLAILAHIDAAETRGYRVEVHCLCRGAWGGKTYEQRWRLKAADEHVDLGRLAFFLGHTAVQRRLLFAACATDERFEPVWVPSQVPADAPDLPPNTVWFGQAVGPDWQTPDSAMKAVATALQEHTAIPADDPLFHMNRSDTT